jgi:ribonuclease Y
METSLILASALTFLIGAIITGALMVVKMKSYKSEKEVEAEKKLEAAREKAQEIKKNAKHEAKQIIRDERNKLEDEFDDRVKKLNEQERALAKKEIALDQKIEAKELEVQNLKRKEDELQDKIHRTQQEKDKYLQRQGEIAEKLSQVAQMSKEEAKEELIRVYEEEAKVDAAQKIARIEEEAEEESEKRSKRILGIALQRFAGEYVAEQTITSVELPGDEIKGRLIGREGRNIRAFEQICGVDLIIDDTPGMVVISSFNVVRKQVAKMTIEKLIADGRIHPAKIEEFHDKSKAEMEARLRELGEKAQMEIGIHGLHPEVLKNAWCP